MIEWIATATGALILFLFFLLRSKSRQLEQARVENLDEKIKGHDGAGDASLHAAEDKRKEAEDDYEKLRKELGECSHDDSSDDNDDRGYPG